MSLHRRNPKRDAVEPLIVDALVARGFHVDRVSAPGFPDLVVSKRGPNGSRHVWFIEVKQPKGRYTPKQITWRSKWQGPQPWTIRTVEEALKFPDVTP